MLRDSIIRGTVREIAKLWSKMLSIITACSGDKKHDLLGLTWNFIIYSNSFDFVSTCFGTTKVVLLQSCFIKGFNEN